MRIKTTLKEMKDADVRFISLVTRGANRIPFRIVKSDKENGMINLGNIKKVLKGESAAPKTETPEVVAVVVMDQDQATMEGIQKALADNGLNFDKATKNEDGTVVLAAGDIPEDSHIVRLSEDMALVVKGFSAYSEALTSSADFSDVMAAQGFYQGLRTACDAAVSTIQNILYKAESNTDAAIKVGGVLSKFSTYVTALTKGLPAAAFKAETSVAEVLATAAVAKAEAAKSEAAKSEGTPEGSAGGTEGSPEGSASGTTEAAPEGAANGEQSADEGAVALKQVLDQLSALAEAVKGVSGEVAEVAKSQSDLSGRVDEIARKAETATQAVQATVVAGAGAGDEPAPTQTTQKSEKSDLRSGCFDTGFMRRPR